MEILIVTALFSAGACGWIAHEKGRDWLGYAALGFLIPLLGIVVVAAIPRKP